MDLTFKTGEGVFNYRVCAIIIRDGKILAMHDQRPPYYYLPGGRVQLHEAADHAILREVREELQVEGRIIRPLWLNQGFFMEDVTGKRFHELCLYYLVDVSHTDLPQEDFCITEGDKPHKFVWLRFKDLEDLYFYPVFLKKKIFELPEYLTILAEYE